eukprot:2914261-Pleurochrysis_carterae.AAC.1
MARRPHERRPRHATGTREETLAQRSAPLHPVGPSRRRDILRSFLFCANRAHQRRLQCNGESRVAQRVVPVQGPLRPA